MDEKISIPIFEKNNHSNSIKKKKSVLFLIKTELGFWFQGARIISIFRTLCRLEWSAYSLFTVCLFLEFIESKYLTQLKKESKPSSMNANLNEIHGLFEENPLRIEIDISQDPYGSVWLKLITILVYVVEVIASMVMVAFVVFETQGLAGHYRTLINQLLSYLYGGVSSSDEPELEFSGLSRAEL